MSERLRTFVALMLGSELGGEVGGALERWIDRPGVRAYAAADLHLTLVFLGGHGPTRYDGLERALAGCAARHRPLDLELAGTGAFPRAGSERILWIGVDGRDLGELASLQDDVARACAALGFEPETKPWRAHVTVARVRGDRRGVVPAGFHHEKVAARWKPSRLAWVESLAGRTHASAGGSSYRPIVEFELGAADR